MSTSRIDGMMVERIKAELLLLALLLAATLASVAIAYYRSIHISMEQLSHYAGHDSLTNLLNRRSFNSSVRAALENTTTVNRICILLYIDLDGFKSVNDTYGHQRGDKILKDIALIIEKRIRVNDIAARIGGDEFAVALAHCPEEKSRDIAELIRAGIEAYGQQELIDNSISASIGLVTIQPGCDLEDQVKKADQACYYAKNSGKNNVVVFEELQARGLVSNHQ